ncbi:hypothetical protein DUI87_26295 [Hirundo rustica rustica]|uniref:Integrase-type domain-containing protein n=1 Tax=Hirundo rustica rustica TaxID=333673 RepID=A0A3M0JE08_HIRRU|nr:hypothetical protein DUI87_26295 [Hirundo rustica rustica]
MILTDSQFIIWEAKWRRALNELRDKYQRGANAGLTVAQLAGDPPLDNPAHQARLFPREVLTDIKNAARKAMVKIPSTGVTESSYTDIKQGPSKSFTSLIDRLTQAVDRQVSDEGVKPHLIWCLAFANANPECKRIISAKSGQPSVAEMIRGMQQEPTPPIVRHFSNSTIAKLKENPLVLVRNPETGQIEGPFKLITWGKGYACVSTAVKSKWLVARHVKLYRVQTQADADPKTREKEVSTQK